LQAQFSGKEEFPLDDQVLGEVATIEVATEEWIMRFDGSSTANLRGARMVLYHGEREMIALSFKLEFSCSNNTVEGILNEASSGSRDGNPALEGCR